MADHSHSPLLTNASKGAIQLFTSNKVATATAVGTIILPDMAGCYCLDAKFEYITNGSETIQIFGSYDGTNFSDALVPFDVATGLPAANAVLEEGSYILPRTWNFNHYKITGSSTSDIKVVAFAATIVPK